ncbi:hypothetical protein TSUD_74310 [Trifolium subterraneum]|nr:hypothetical protein TSUD_74310 [Trifolium subterraneum]
MGIGIAISCLATLVAALVEKKRRNEAIREGFMDNPKGVVNMSAMWLVPQHCLVGLAEALNVIGQIDWAYGSVEDIKNWDEEEVDTKCDEEEHM